jgi:phospholipase C
MSLTRRGLLKAAGGLAAAAALRTSRDRWVIDALASGPACGRLEDIEHVVILMQENRSFDHYFGTLRGVRGFSDANAMRLPNGDSVFAQPDYRPHRKGLHLLPFRLDTVHKSGECTNDISHSWAVQHRAWNRGHMDHWTAAHQRVDGPLNGPLTMGYMERADLPFYHALADAFTICDHYFCSAMGPTDPNRLYSMSATIDPEGRAGGPLLQTHLKRLDRSPRFSWTTMPEQLDARQVSWKVYGSPQANVNSNVLVYFNQFRSNRRLAARAFKPRFPDTFVADAKAGTLPNVSWIIPPYVPRDESEHPPSPVTYGEYATYQVLKTLTRDPSLWAKTALLVTWDENGGFFDHVAPPAAPVGTPGEYLTTKRLPPGAEGIRGPVGLGFRVPMLIASPFARGGFLSSDVFDHTSILRFLETRFGAEVPNLSSWRRGVTGDLTSAFNFATPDTSVPSLPPPVLNDPRIKAAGCPVRGKRARNYPVPKPRMPRQEPGTRTPRGDGTCGPAP